jgi:hypothetical protein
MADFDRRTVDAATEQLRRIPGVFIVSVGSKWYGGRLTDQTALVVFVRRKLPLDAVAARHRIPREIAGMPTDVVEADEPALTKEDPAKPTLKEVPLFDGSEYTQIRGGILIEAVENGTIACVARCTDAQNNGKIVMLTNQHVVSPSHGSGVGASVYQPESSSWCCGRKIAKVLRGRRTTLGAFFNKSNDTSVDTALALLNPGIECFAEQQIGIGNGTAAELVQGVLPTDQITITPPMPVKKRGPRIGSQNGMITNLDVTFPTGTPGDKDLAFRHQLLVVPNVPAGTTTGVFRFQLEGDSGAALMTAAGDKIVGLMHSQIVLRPKETPDLVLVAGIATDINVVINAMQISIATSNALGQVITVPATNVLPAPAGVAEPVPAFTRTMLDQARVQIEATTFGRVYADIIRRHHNEVRALVRSNRRVGAIWKHYGGQGILQAALDAVGHPDAPIPSVVASRELADCAAHISAVLKRYGSASLAHDAHAYERLVGVLPGRSYNQLLTRLRAGESLES